MRPVIVVHGGAGAYSTIGDLKSLSLYRKGVVEAAQAGYTILKCDGSALDAVEAAVVAMEDNPTFNAGKGSYLTRDFTVEMDAVIMDGSSHKVGAVGCITGVKNPVHVARLIMDKSEHCLFVGDGASKMAEILGAQRISSQELVTEKSVKKLEDNPDWNPSLKDQVYERSRAIEHDTVGAVAIDIHGNTAVATSTGGITAKEPGRMGDSACVGGGGYADDDCGVISTTGHGESLMKTCVARHASFLMESGAEPREALEKSLKFMQRKTGGNGGAIAVNRDGSIGVHFTTEGMSWASIQDGCLTHGIFPKESLGEDDIDN